MSRCGGPLTAQNAELLDKRDSAGDVATAGVAPKAWIRRDGAFWLLKDGDPREVEAELTASRVARCFDVEQARYEPGEYGGQRVSVSRLMTTKDRGIVPAEYVDTYAANAGTTLEAIVKKRDRYGFHMMNVVDYLVGNTDRHWGNWGFWVDNRTNRLEKLHPLMDFNKAFCAYDSTEGARCLTVKESLSQREAAVMAVKAVGLNQTRPLPEGLPEMLYRRYEILKNAEAR